MHGFFADTKAKTLRFDVVLSFEIDSKEGLRIVMEEVKEICPDYQITVTPDVDLSD